MMHNNPFQTYHMRDFPRKRIVYCHAKANKRYKTVSYLLHDLPHPKKKEKQNRKQVF